MKGRFSSFLTIDLSVNHTFFGIEKTTKNQHEKLRKKARRYILDVISNELEDNLKSMGLKGFRIENVEETIDGNGIATTVASDKDPSVIDFIPHEGLIPDWKSDYAEMCDHFIYGTKLSFAELIDRMKELQERFRKIR